MGYRLLDPSTIHNGRGVSEPYCPRQAQLQTRMDSENILGLRDMRSISNHHTGYHTPLSTLTSNLFLVGLLRCSSTTPCMSCIMQSIINNSCESSFVQQSLSSKAPLEECCTVLFLQAIHVASCSTVTLKQTCILSFLYPTVNGHERHKAIHS